MSSDSSRSWTASPNLRWSSIRRSAFVEVAVGAAFDELAPQLHEFLRPGGGAWPVSRSRTIMASASSIGASARSVISSNLPRWKRSSSMAVRIFGDARHAARADRLDARLLDRLEHAARLRVARHQLAMHFRIVAGEFQRDRIGVAAHDRGIAPRHLARRLRQPRLARRQAGALGGERHFQLRLARDRAQAAGDRALERLGRGFLWPGFSACYWRTSTLFTPIFSIAHAPSARPE